MQLLFDSGYTATNDKFFKKYNWFDFYQYAKEAISPNIFEARVHGFIARCSVDANHGGNMKDWKSNTGVLILINKVPIYWYSKSQTTVEAITFGAEFCAMNMEVEIIEALRYKLEPQKGPVCQAYDKKKYC